MIRHSWRTLTLATTLLLTTACDVTVDVETNTEAEKETAETHRFATFNIAMGFQNEGEMAALLEAGDDERLTALATILQLTRPDVILITEFDYDPTIDAAGLLNQNYLGISREGLEPVSYPYNYRPTVNTGEDSGLDLDGNGETGEPTDAWGFGRFPGQYGMLVLSKYPIDSESIRSFQNLKWSDLPDALRPYLEDGESFYPDNIWEQLRLSSKNHVDVPIRIGDETVHFLLTHPTPPGFDGPEDRNGRRNHDELALWAHYIGSPGLAWALDDQNRSGGLQENSKFIVAGDLNADPQDGGSFEGAIAQLLEHPKIDSNCIPTSSGGAEASKVQGGSNLGQTGDPAADTSDFNDERVGNLRIDYVLPSAGLNIKDCGVFWPASDEPHHELVNYSDHRLVWLDFSF